MGAITETLRQELLQPDFSEGYAESFQDALVAAQIKVLREDNEWTQADLAAKIGTTQTAISRIENVNYSAWNISTLKKLARAFRVRLKVSFETYGSLLHDVDGFSRESLRRAPREKDPELNVSIQQPDALLSGAPQDQAAGFGLGNQSGLPVVSQPAITVRKDASYRYRKNRKEKLASKGTHETGHKKPEPAGPNRAKNTPTSGFTGGATAVSAASARAA